MHALVHAAISQDCDGARHPTLSRRCRRLAAQAETLMLNIRYGSITKWWTAGPGRNGVDSPRTHASWPARKNGDSGWPL
jgi:hypothetical protein